MSLFLGNAQSQQMHKEEYTVVITLERAINLGTKGHRVSTIGGSEAA